MNLSLISRYNIKQNVLERLNVGSNSVVLSIPYERPIEDFHFIFDREASFEFTVLPVLRDAYQATMLLHPLQIGCKSL